MSETRKAHADYAYFWTMTVVGWADIFTRKEYCEMVLDSLQFCQKAKGLDIFAYVIMPSHIHVVGRREKERLGDLIRDFKSFTAKQIINEIERGGYESRKDWLLHLFQFHAKYKRQNDQHMFWQKTNYPIELSTPYLVDQKIEYVHQNPVAAGIVLEPEMYVYSSANPLSRVKTLQA